MGGLVSRILFADRILASWCGACVTTATVLSPSWQSPTHKAKRQQMDLIAELKKKQLVKEPLIFDKKDGAIEDIITGEEEGGREAVSFVTYR